MKAGIGRSDRIYLHIPLILAGKDKRGLSFEEKNQTIFISRRGVYLETTQSLEPGTVLTVEMSRGERFEASVVWTGKPSAKGADAIEIECPRFAEALGLYFPPGA